MFKWLKRLFVIARTRPTTRLDSITRADIGFEPGALTWLDCPRRLWADTPGRDASSTTRAAASAEHRSVPSFDGGEGRRLDGWVIFLYGVAS